MADDLLFCLTRLTILAQTKKQFIMFTKKLITITTITVLFINSLVAQQWNPLPLLIVGTDTAAIVSEIDSYTNNLYFSTDKGLFKSSDNGNNWTNLTWTNGVAANQIITNTFVDTSNSYIYVSSDSSIYKSIDNGASWVTTAINNNLKFINDINKLGNNIVVAHGNYLGGGIQLSSDDLNSVQVASIANIEIRDILDFSGAGFVAGTGGTYKSTDNGLNWNPIGIGHPVGGKYGEIISEGNRILASDIFGKGLYKSDDNGVTWGRADSSTFHSFCQVFDMVESNGTILTTVDGSCTAAAPIKSSVDNGNNWGAFMTNLPSAWYPTLGVNASTGCFFTFNRGTKVPYRYCTSTDITNVNNDSSKMLVYPNPADNFITITTELKIKKITIIDVAGKEIKSFNQSNKVIDVSDLSNGIYFIQVYSDTEMVTQKIIKQ